MGRCVTGHSRSRVLVFFFFSDASSHTQLFDISSRKDIRCIINSFGRHLMTELVLQLSLKE